MVNKFHDNYEKEFIQFCRRHCGCSCDTMKLHGKKTRADILIDCCPILGFEIRLQAKYKIDNDIKIAVNNITSSREWTSLGGKP